MTQTSSPRRRTTASAVGLACVVLILLFTAGLLLAWRQDRALPQYQGQSARVWLDRMRRQLALEEAGKPASAAERIRARRAFLAMGTNAHPFLVARHLAATESTTLMQRAYDRVAGELQRMRVPFLTPRWLDSAAARECLANHPVPMTFLRAAVAQRLSGASNAPPPYPVLELLGLAAPADRPEATSRLVEAYLQYRSNPALGSAALRNLERHGTLSGELVAALEPALTDRSPTIALMRLRLAYVLGPAAPSLRPWLAEIAQGPDENLSLRAALALLQSDPTNTLALAVVTRLLQTPESPKPSWLRPGETPASRVAQCLDHAGTRTNATIADLLEPWARACWQERPESNPHRHLAIHTLTRLDPERARRLLDEHLEGPLRIEAAEGRLRLDRNHPRATQVLVESIEAQPWWNTAALSALREASASNQIAVATLTCYAEGSRTFPLQGEGARRHARTVRELAELGLEWIAYREERNALGLDAPSW